MCGAAQTTMNDGAIDPNRPPPGKLIGAVSYFHRSVVDRLDRDLQLRIDEAQLHAGCLTWNVVKVRHDAPHRLSLLTYEDFSAEFPCLLESLSIDLSDGRIVSRSYRTRANPPVLHRKELLLSPDDPAVETFARLTAELEGLGLFTRPTTIGTRLAWEARLTEAGVQVRDHQVTPLSEVPPADILRHRSAMHRDGLSTPVQALLRFGVIGAETSVFDYGCGRGSDMEGLSRLGIVVDGWDPHYRPTSVRRPADVVNLGFVLNVIERPLERAETLRAAFELTRRCLAVSALQPSSTRWCAGRPFLDGVITRLGTFQKTFTTPELKVYVEAQLGRRAHIAAPGVVLVFSDPAAEEDYLARRQYREWPTEAWLAERRQRRRSERRQALSEEVEALQTVALNLGRWPAVDEIPSALGLRLAATATSFSTLLAIAREDGDPVDLDAAADRRREDIALHFALNHFDRRSETAAHPERLRRDVRALFSTMAQAREAGRRILFSMADGAALLKFAEAAEAQQLGQCLEDDFWVGAANAPLLPAALRCFIGCAERYYGDLSDAQVLKLHLATGKVTAQRYPGFATSPFPRLETRVKIDLRRQRIDEFDHASEDQRLLRKSVFMASGDPERLRQMQIEQALEAGGLDRTGFRARGEEIAELLKPLEPDRSRMLREAYS